MQENIGNSERPTFTMTSATKPVVNTPVCLDTTAKRRVKASTLATDVIIGSISSVEGGGSPTLWNVTVPINGCIKEITCFSTIAIGNRLVPNTSSQLIAQAVNLAGTNNKFSPGIALESLGSGETADIEVLLMPQYIPVT